MSWQEKTEKYLTKQQQIRKEKEERGEKIKENLANILEELPCREMLTQIRDEIWRSGKIKTFKDHVIPSIGKIIPFRAGIRLHVVWPFYRPVYEHMYDRDNLLYETIPAAISVRHESLSIVAYSYDEESEYLMIGYNYMFGPFYRKESIGNFSLPWKGYDKTKASRRIEELLIKHCLWRKKQKCPPPFDQQKKIAEQQTIKGIIEEGLTPPEGYEYLLDLAKTQTEQPKTTRTSEDGFLRKLLGKQ